MLARTWEPSSYVVDMCVGRFGGAATQCAFAQQGAVSLLEARADGAEAGGVALRAVDELHAFERLDRVYTISLPGASRPRGAPSRGVG